MVDKRDKNDLDSLVGSIQRICHEHRAMREILLEQLGDFALHDARELTKERAMETRIGEQFYGSREALRATPPAASIDPSIYRLAGKLIQAINQTQI